MTVPPAVARVGAAARLLGAAMLVLGCGAGTPATSAPGAPTATAAPVTAAPGTASATTPATAPSTVHLGDADNGRTVTVARGDEVVVTLDSTYWTFSGSSDASVLVEDGSPVYGPHPAGCVPGQGCGTVTERFTAVGDGRAAVRASRTTCGEALACTGTSGSWAVTVAVGG